MDHALYGFSVGTRLAAQLHPIFALPYLIKPVNYWRRVEFEQTCAEGGFEAGQKILDVGSPKLLAMYLAEKVGAEVWATDIEPYFLTKLAAAREARGIPTARLHLDCQDGRALTFDDATFDRVYSISVLEHIPDEGDSACVKELARVLKPGGRVVITVPFWPTSRDEYRQGGFYWARSSKQEQGKGTFYQRRYSEDDVRRRLVAPSGLKLRTLAYVGETAPALPGHEFSELLPKLSGPIQPLLSRVFHTPPSSDWRSLKRPLCVVLCLEK